MSFPPPPLPAPHNPNSFHNQKLAGLPPIWKNKLDQGIHLRVYKNGDHNYPGRDVTLNKKQFRTFESWLSDLSNSMKLRNGAVWRVYTPTNGTRKDDFEDFQDGQTLVVAGQERFKPLRYEEITPVERKKAPPFKYDADPVIHNRRLQHSGKINKIETRSKLIKVWPNGDDLRGPRRVLLTPRINPYNLENVISHVNEIMKEDCNGTVEKLYLLSGIKVSDVDQISHNGLYVACKKTDRFRPCRYNESGTKNIATSPRLERKFLAPINSRSTNSNQSSPEHSNASTQNSVNGYPARRRAPRREEDQVFPARPVKHTRSSEKARNVDLDKDQGGVFKAKQTNKNTSGAREIQDSRHTRTDLPVDQRQAKTVEEERIPNGRKAAPRNGYPPKGQEVETRTNSKRTPPSQQQKQTPPQQQKHREQKKTPPAKKDDLERQKSAAKIQAGFRGYQTRKNLKQKQPPARASPSPPPPQRRSPSPPPPQRRSPSPRNDRDSTPRRSPAPAPVQQEQSLLMEEDLAAAKIQAGFRGHQARKRMQDEREALEDRAREIRDEEERRYRERKEEEEKAAAKIQAGFRGYASRKNSQLSNMRSNVANDIAEWDDGAASPAVQPQREDSYDSLDREIHAATKIQSSYRGYMTRKGISERQK